MSFSVDTWQHYRNRSFFRGLYLYMQITIPLFPLFLSFRLNNDLWTSDGNNPYWNISTNNIINDNWNRSLGYVVDAYPIRSGRYPFYILNIYDILAHSHYCRFIQLNHHDASWVSIGSYWINFFLSVYFLLFVILCQ